MWRVRTQTDRTDGGAPPRHHGAAVLDEGGRVVVGRSSPLPIGVDPQDDGVSRRAAVVEVVGGLWRITTANGNGAALHRWGLATALAQPTELVDWPRVALRLRGARPDLVHWVLLETDREPPVAPEPGVRPGATNIETPPLPLSAAQERALRMVFAPQLAWPPSLDPPLQIKQVARQLQVGETAVQNLLRKAQNRALRLGLAQPVELTRPDYLHVLVAAGYLGTVPPPGP